MDPSTSPLLSRWLWISNLNGDEGINRHHFRGLWWKLNCDVNARDDVMMLLMVEIMTMTTTKEYGKEWFVCCWHTHFLSSSFPKSNCLIFRVSTLRNFPLILVHHAYQLWAKVICVKKQWKSLLFIESIMAQSLLWAQITHDMYLTLSKSLLRGWAPDNWRSS